MLGLVQNALKLPLIIVTLKNSGIVTSFVCVQIDEFPLNQEVALQLAGLHAQVLWGDYTHNMSSRYDEIEQFLHSRIIKEDRNKTREDWKRAIANAHKVSFTHTVGLNCSA